jgi:hypothetical protein
MKIVNAKHKRSVEAGGGIYVPGEMGGLVLFNSPTTGSTLALPGPLLSAESVRAHIAESDALFAKASK